MPFTEFVTPLLKQDAASKAAFLVALPLLKKGIARAPGYKQQVYGNIISENGVDVGPELKPALAAEWEEERNLQDFLASNDFKDFGVQIKPLAAGPPDPQLYKTDLEPSTIFAAALTEVFRIPIAEEGKAGQVQHAWKKFVDAVVLVESQAKKLSEERPAKTPLPLHRWQQPRRY